MKRRETLFYNKGYMQAVRDMHSELEKLLYKLAVGIKATDEMEEWKKALGKRTYPEILTIKKKHSKGG